MLRHGDVIGQVQQGWGGEGIGLVRPLWRKATLSGRRAMAAEPKHQQEEAARCTKAVSQEKQHQCINLENAERKKLGRGVAVVYGGKPN